ncbi:unnamed protein product [Schistosoma margrebowiei]|uniref:Uncharacterized protein n=1 Tax=Schistosoma margrebowiei TaxID=48269 RepID=A0A183N644_9TREM|nr:unnamed protein product [Schistosoma margrebowiei]
MEGYKPPTSILHPTLSLTILDTGFVLLGTRQQGVPVILRELVLPGGFDPVSPSFTGFSSDPFPILMFLAAQHLLVR